MVEPSQKISNSSANRHAGGSKESAASRSGEGRTAAGLPMAEARNSAPDPEQIRRLLTGPEGQALLRILQADGGAGVRAASAALREGNPQGAMAALSPLLTGTEAENLTRKLEEQL